jgi:hypothetical protein
MLMTLRYAFRSIRSAPLASGVVVLCIGSSIGATTTVFVGPSTWCGRGAGTLLSSELDMETSLVEAGP